MKNDQVKKTVAIVGVVAQCGLIATLLFAPSARVVLGGLAILALACMIELLCLRQKSREQEKGTKKVVEPEAPPAVPPHGQTEDKLPASYFERYLGLIAEKHGKAAAERVKGDVTAILGKDSNGRIDEILSRPESKGRAKGLVVGRVQSGKTQNYTGLITRAIDEGWRIIVVLTSNNTALAGQTIARLRTDLSVSGLTDDKYRMIDFLSDDLPTIERGKIYAGVALKQVDHLRGRGGNAKGVLNWLKKNNSILNDARILIVDDEADNATQNTVAGQDDWSDITVLEYAQRIVAEAESEDDKVNAGCVAAWIKSLDELEIDMDDQVVADLKALVKKPFFSDNVMAVDGKESRVKVNNVIENPAYRKGLGLEAKVDTAKVREELHGATSTQEKLIRNLDLSGGLYSNKIKNFFIPAYGQADRAKEFRQILRWFLNVRRERSEINKAICQLVSPKTLNCGSLAYVGYTATPYADFLNEGMGADNPLEIDFIQSMSLSPEYFGLLKIFGKDGTKEKPRMPIVKEIPDEDRDKKLSESLKNAIKWAMVAASVRRARRIEKGVSENDDKSRSERWSTMLVNLSRKIEDHCDLRERIKTYIADSLKDMSGFKKECLALFDAFVGDIDAECFKKLFPDYAHDVRDLCREDVENNLDYVFEHYKVVALNSDGDKDVYCEYVQDVRKGEKLFGDYLWIVVGGNRISRGLTFDGLVSSYFDRDKVTVNVDTLTQMGRWFGYRVGYELLPRVWMPQGTVKTMKEICALEEDMHAQFSDMFERHDVKPNVRVLSISKRLTGRDAGAEVLQGVENPVIVREFFAKADVDSRQQVAEFLDACDRTGTFGGRPDQNAIRVWQRLYEWQAVDCETVKEFLDKICTNFSRREGARILRAMAELKSYDKFDVVLSDPTMTGTEGAGASITLHRAKGDIDIYRHEISQSERLEDGSWRFGKFTGQYDAWKAVVPGKVVASVEKDYGVKSHTNEMMNELFKRNAEAEGKNNPILQVGFIHVGDCSVPYVSIYCPGKECLSQGRTGTANVLDGSHNEISHDAALKKPLNNVGPLATPKAVPRSPVKPVATPGAEVEKQEPMCSSTDDKSVLTDGQKKGIKKVLEKIAAESCPWRVTADLKDEIKDGVEEKIKTNQQVAMFAYVKQCEWTEEPGDQGNGTKVYAPSSFAIKGTIKDAIRQQIIECAKDILKKNGKPMSGGDLWKESVSEWARRRHVPATNLKCVVTNNNTIPSKEGEKEKEVVQKLMEHGIDVQINKDRQYIYSFPCGSQRR